MKILLVEDDALLREAMKDALEAEGHCADACSSGERALRFARETPYDCFIVDLMLEGKMGGLDLLGALKEEFPLAEVIVVTAHGSVESAVAALRCGAFDYLLKPFDMEELLSSVRNVDGMVRLKTENMRLRSCLRLVGGRSILVGESEAIRRVREDISAVAPVEETVLITGESGTGKEVVADQIHAMSRRADAPLVKISCAAMPEGLVEAELFGCEKGAFTGALASRPGRFRAADGGTLFLDDVDDIPLGVQVKLLRCIERKELWPVGASSPVTVDVRIIAATKKDLREEVRAGRFREDLFYRLNVLHVEIPPLRERLEDIPLLVRHFVEMYGGCDYGVEEGVMEFLMEYDWPGNVRELENAVKRALLLGRDERLLRKEHFPIRGMREGHEGSLPTLAEALKRTEKVMIERALRAAGGSVTKAAALLGISRKNLWEKMKKLSLQDNPSTSGSEG